MEILTFIILLVIIAVVVSVLIGTGIIRVGRVSVITPPPSDPISFHMTPKLICRDSGCSVEIDYSVQTIQNGASVSFSVQTPTNTVIPISDQLNLQRNIPGDDLFWVDGPGHYVFTWIASGLLQGTRTIRHDVTVAGPAGLSFNDFISFRFGANDVNRRIATDIATFGTVQGKKGRSLETCEKYMTLRAIRYLSGGIAGYPDELSVSVFDGQGRLVANSVILKPSVSGSDTLTLPSPLPIANGIAIVSDLVSGAGPEFPIGQAITWNLVYEFGCI